MFTPLVVLIVAATTALAGWALWFAIRDRAVILRQLWGASVVEGLLLVQVVVSVISLAQIENTVDPFTFWGYLITILFIAPVAAVWAFAERSRWSSVVLAAAALTIVFLEFRLVQIWGVGV